MMPLNKNMRVFLRLAVRVPDGRPSHGNESIY